MTKLKRRVLKCTKCDGEIVTVHKDGKQVSTPNQIVDSIRAHFSSAHGDEHFSLSNRIDNIEAVNEYEPEAPERVEESEGTGPREDM